MGAEVGLPPMASLQNIAVINGRPSLWGDAQLAVVRGTGELEEFDEWTEVNGKRQARPPKVATDDTTAVCRVKLKGYPPREGSFSVADAKTANLWSKEGPWKQYPFRMLQMRARAFVLRDMFGDALRGMRSTEEYIGGPTIDIETMEPEPAKQVKLYAAPQVPDAPVAVSIVPESEPETVTAASETTPAPEPPAAEAPEAPEASPVKE
jgi:hypothetical protein